MSLGWPSDTDTVQKMSATYRGVYGDLNGYWHGKDKNSASVLARSHEKTIMILISNYKWTPHSPCDCVCTLARIWIWPFVIYVLNQKATQISQRLHSLNLTIWVKGEEEKRDSGINNLGGGSTLY